MLMPGPFCKSQITTSLMGHLAGMQNFLSEKVLLQSKWLILFCCKILANKALEEKLEAEVTQVDQKVVLELDQLVSDQQATLQVRIVPLFFVFTRCLLSFWYTEFLILSSYGRFHCWYWVYRLNVNVIVVLNSLQRAGVPLFSITNNPDDIRLQMYILDFIQRLDHTPS